MRRINLTVKAVSAALLALVLIFGTVSASAAVLPSAVRTSARAQSDRRSSELSPFAEDGSFDPTRSGAYTPADDFSTIRVLITTGSTSTIRFNLCGAYYIGQNNVPLNDSAAAPLTVTVRASGGQITAAVNDQQLYSGTQLDICRVNEAEAGGYAELRTSANSNNDQRKYLGNLRLTANTDGTVRFVNVVPTAHYLYGIIPYEMSEGCNIEALKAQAVTAKTYAFGFPYGASDYDISDSFTYQGYRGYTPGYTKCMQACLSTVGQILIYNGTVPLAFYGATNGGETALPSHAFGTSPLDDAYEIKLDNTDFSYGSSKVKTLSIAYGQAVTNASFKRLLEAEAASVVGHSVTLVSVTSASVNTPKFPGTQRNLTKMDATLTVNDGGTVRSVSVRFDVTKLKSYGVFSGAYKIYWGRAVSGGYEVYFCRWGHGLGLSQYGADGYAATGWSFEQIVRFYFGRMQLTQVAEQNPEDPAVQPPTEVVAYGVVNTAGTRMRSGPGTEYQIITQLSRNTHVDIVTEASGWLLCIAGEQLGYIRGDLVDIVLFPSPLGAEVLIGRGFVSSTATNALVLGGPSDYCDPVCLLRPGATVEVWHELGDWYHIRSGRRYGFIEKSKLIVQYWAPVGSSGSVIANIGEGQRP